MHITTRKLIFPIESSVGNTLEPRISERISTTESSHIFPCQEYFFLTDIRRLQVEFPRKYPSATTDDWRQITDKNLTKLLYV